MTKATPKASGQLFAEPESPSARLEGVYTANIDGAARGNPGPASYGLALKRPDGTTLESLGKYIGRTTNNVAEYYALIAALDYAVANGIKRLRVQSARHVNRLVIVIGAFHSDKPRRQVRARHLRPTQVGSAELGTGQHGPATQQQGTQARTQARTQSGSTTRGGTR